MSKHDKVPLTCVNGTLLVSVTGRASATVTEVALVESSSSVEIKGVVEPQGNNSFLVQFDMMPSVEFVVRMKGQDSSTPPVVFQRQSPTSFRTSNITFTVSLYPKSKCKFLEITVKEHFTPTKQGCTTSLASVTEFIPVSILNFTNMCNITRFTLTVVLICTNNPAACLFSYSRCLQANPDDILVPGTPFTVPFTVTSRGRGGNFTIRATNNQNRFNSTSPASLVLEAGGSVNGTVNISAPLNTPSGTEVTLTIEAEAPEGTDLNYIVLRISVVNTVIV